LSVASWPRAVIIHDEVFHFRARPGMWVIDKLAHNNWWSLIWDNLTPAGQQYVAGRLVDRDDEFDMDHINLAVHYLTQEVMDFDYPPAVRLAGGILSDRAAFEAWSILHGFNPENETPRRLLAAMFAKVMENTDEKTAPKMIRQIWTPAMLYTIKPISPHAKTGWSEPEELDLTEVAFA